MWVLGSIGDERRKPSVSRFKEDVNSDPVVDKWRVDSWVVVETECPIVLKERIHNRHR